MKLQTQVPLRPAAHQIDYKSRILLLGSCFSQNIGQKFDYFKFWSLQNPFGILFHPKAIETLIDRAIYQKTYIENELFFLNERWHCFDAHSNLSDVSKEDLLRKLNNGLQRIHQEITKATHIVLTFGSAWVYKHLATGKIVANCHKVPQKEFTKSLLSIAEVGESLESIIAAISAVNESAQFIFTISPVRHLKDGFVENQRSKAHLIAALHAKMSSPFMKGGRGEVYFPSYEIMMDELRDYRFYEADMIHPTPLAIDLIWDKFKTVWISKNTQVTMDQVDVVQKGLQHRPFHADSIAHGDFTRTLQEKIAYLKAKYPFMSF